MFHLTDHLHVPPLNSLLWLMAFLYWSSQSWMKNLRSQERRIEGHNPSWTCCPCFFRLAAEDTVGFLDCKCTMLGRIEFLIHQQLQVPLFLSALNPFFSQPVFWFWVAPTRHRTLHLALLNFMSLHRPISQTRKITL